MGIKAGKIQPVPSVNKHIWGYSSAGSPVEAVTHPSQNLINVLSHIWGYSSAGRALEWHSRGQRFDPAYLHHESTGKVHEKALNP